ncbi:MAG: T9SS type A sorting domain-containing protein, partial [Flavobacteriales bacterium]
CVSDSTNVYDCAGVLNGPAMPGTPCTIPGTILEGTWSANCSCESNDPAPCEAGFWVMQAYAGVDSLGNPNGGGEPVPNVLWVWNLSSGGTGEFTFLWSFGDGTSSTEAFPTHTYANGGPYALCLTITDVTGCTDTYCDSISVDENGMYSGMVVGSEVRSALTINVIQPLTTGVIERPAVAEMATWPNPVTDELNIQLSSSLRGSVNVDILDLSGRTLMANKRTLTDGANRLSVPTSELTPGVYVLRIGSGSAAQVIRFVKTR